MRALAVLLLATPAAADVSAIAEGDHVVACFEGCPCRVIDPATGRVTGTRDALPATFEINDVEPSPDAALARCKACGALRKQLAGDETRTVTVDPTGKLLFVMDSEYPARGHLWSLVTGKRVSSFPIDDFDGPPPPTSFEHADFIGRHVFVGDPGKPYAITFDIYTGAMGMLFEHAGAGHGLVIENDGSGRFDLADYAQPGHPRVAARRIRSSRSDAPTVEMHAVVTGDKVLVVVEDPPLTLLVDPRKRKIGKPRVLPQCTP